MAVKPLWTAGLPTNLPAAAADALEWLRWLQRAGLVTRDRQRLAGCVETLTRMLDEEVRMEEDEQP